MFHIHSEQSFFDKKTVIRSVILLVLTLSIAVAVISNFEIGVIGQISCLSIPFLFQVIISLFVRNKASWMLGAIAATMLSLIIFVITIYFR